MTKIGIIGNGFVGNAIYQNIKDKIKDVFVFDVDSQKSYNTKDETINCDIVFVCLPTPMREKNGGECNLSYIDTFFDSLPNNINGIFVIKSTVPIGATKNISQRRTDLKIIHNPEFLTARIFDRTIFTWLLWYIVADLDPGFCLLGAINLQTNKNSLL